MQRVVNGTFDRQVAVQQCCRRVALRGPQAHRVGVVQGVIHRAGIVKTQGCPEQPQPLQLMIGNPADVQPGSGHQQRGGSCSCVELRWQCGRQQRRIVKQAVRLVGLKRRARHLGWRVDRVDRVGRGLKTGGLKTPLDHQCHPVQAVAANAAVTLAAEKRDAPVAVGFHHRRDAMGGSAVALYRTCSPPFLLADAVQDAFKHPLLAIQRHALGVGCRAQGRRKRLDVKEKTAPAHAAGLSCTPAAWACSSAW